MHPRVLGAHTSRETTYQPTCCRGRMNTDQLTLQSPTPRQKTRCRRNKMASRCRSPRRTVIARYPQPRPHQRNHHRQTPPQASPPITLQQFADTTTDRVQQLEQERETMLQTQVTLQTQQRQLEAALADMQQQLQSGQLRSNPDVRRKQRQPTTQAPIITQQPLPGTSQTGHLHEAGQLPQHATVIMPNQPLLWPTSHRQAQSQQKAADFSTNTTHVRQATTLPHTGHGGPAIASQPRHLPLWTQALPQQQPIGPPTLSDLRTDASLMDRAAHLVSTNTQEQPEPGNNPKSGLKRDNTEQVCRVIPWPHEHVSRNSGKPPSYDSLTMSEFASGNMRILAQIPGAPPLLVHKATYLSELFDDITDTEWSSARFAHRVVPQAIVNGHADYHMTMEIRQIRTMALTRARRQPTAMPHAASAPLKNKPWGQQTSQQLKRLCLPFQKGECPQPKSHTSAHGFVTHGCAYCQATVNRAYNHPGTDCKRKSQQLKDTKSDDSSQDNH